MNELPFISNLFSTCLFADDTTLIFKSSDQHDLLNSCNMGLDIFYTWCCANRLSINISKTNMMLFSNNLSPLEVSDVYMNNLKIESVSSIRFLGLIIDNKLKFDEHIQNILQKTSKNIGVLYKLRQFVHLNSLIMIYRSLVECYFNYCILVYGNAFPSYTCHIEIAQKKCMRIISHSPPFSHSNPIFFYLKILKFKDIYRFNLGIYMHKNRDKFIQNLYNNPYSSRSGIHYAPTFQRLTLTQNQSLKYQVPLNWLQIPQSIRDTKSLKSFKYKYKSFLISSYSS